MSNPIQAAGGFDFLKPFREAGERLEARADAAAAMVKEFAELAANDPMTVPLDRLNDDDLYVYDVHTKKLIRQIGCSDSYARALKWGRVQLPVGQAFASGMAVKLKGIPLWRSLP